MQLSAIVSARHALNALFVLVLAIGACTHHVRPPSPSEVLPVALLGDFIDDYGIVYSISSTEWFQRPRAKYLITGIDTTAGYLVARNDASNPGEPGLWSRIDWVPLRAMAPYEWAFCMSAYDASTREAAEAATSARHDTPRTGCNGHPFSRMRRATPLEVQNGRAYNARPRPGSPLRDR